MNAFRLLTWFVLIGLSSTTQAGGRSENHFGSIYIDGKKAGQIHYTIEYGEGGDVETLRTRASLSILGCQGVQLRAEPARRVASRRAAPTPRPYRRRRQDLRGRARPWTRTLQGRAQRQAGRATRRAFPASVWHYAIVDRSLLFDLKVFKLMNVKVVRVGRDADDRGREDRGRALRLLGRLDRRRRGSTGTGGSAEGKHLETDGSRVVEQSTSDRTVPCDVDRPNACSHSKPANCHCRP